MKPRLAILADYPEEGWLSMDLAAEMLQDRLVAEHGDRFVTRTLCPPFKRRASWLPVLGRQRYLSTFDRLVNRLRDYPRYLHDVKHEFDVFHVADHSYAALVHALPAERTGVFCHDLDAFRATLDPVGHPRPKWYRAVARHILSGMQRAAVVFHATQEIRRQILERELVDPSKLVHAPLGPAPEFVPNDPPAENGAIDGVVRRAADRPFVLHVGSCALRKRIDVLLDVFALLHRSHPGIRLVKVGGVWTDAMRRQIHRLGMDPDLVHLPWIDRCNLAWLYRRARVLLFPSDAEGFGLPVIEALACGTAVLASDIAVLREVGGDAVTYAPVGDVGAWFATASALLDDPRPCDAHRAARLRRAATFSWSTHAHIVAGAYARLAATTTATTRPHHPRPARSR